jgi:hypothetical protein
MAVPAAFTPAGATVSQAGSQAVQAPVGTPAGMARPATPATPASTPAAGPAAGGAQALGRDGRGQGAPALGAEEIDRIVERVERRFMQRLATESERRGKIR